MDELEKLDDPKYISAYSEKSFFDKVVKFAKEAGIDLIYAALLLFYVLEAPTTPNKVKLRIMGALGYFISPLDIIPDPIPLFGFSDDLAVLIGVVIYAAMYVTEDIKAQAKERLHIWFGDYDNSALDKIDVKIKNKEA